jgi:hypothetical protein
MNVSVIQGNTNSVVPIFPLAYFPGERRKWVWKGNEMSQV